MNSDEAGRSLRSRSARPTGLAVRSVSAVDVLAVLAILGLAAQGPAFLYDDVLYFNYVNNVDHPALLYFYSGYVSPLLQIPTYLLRGLPFIVQAMLYRAIAFLVIVLLYRELKALFLPLCTAIEAALLAVAIILLSRFADAFFLTLFSYTIWSALVVAIVYVLRKRAAGTPYSALGGAGILLSGISNPVGLVLAPALLFDAAFAPKHAANRATNALIGGAILVWSVLVYLISPQAPRWGAVDPAAILSAFRFWFQHDPKRQIVIIVASGLVLATAVAMAGLAPARRVRSQILFVSYLGAASYLFYLMSPRFPANLAAGAAFLPHYAIVLVVCSAIALIFALNGIAAIGSRPAWNGAVFGFCLALAVVAIYPSVSGPLRRSSEKYAFLIAAAKFRADCQAGNALVYEEDRWSPLIFCRASEFPDGFTPVAAYTLWNREPNATLAPLDRPRIYAGTPLL